MSRGAAFLDQLADALDDLLPRGERVILAVSGGADSLALLLGWARLASARQDQLVVAHFDHRWRRESAADARFVEELAASRSIEFRGEVSNVPAGQGAMHWSEEAARGLRYDFLERVAAAESARYVATGHTADDQVETVLFSILRGTSFHGLAGMPGRRALGPETTLIRPLRSFARRQTVEFVTECGIRPREDSTNLETAWTRNWIRLELLPMIRARVNPRVDEAILRLADQAAAVDDWLAELAGEVLAAALIERTPAEVLLSTEAIESVPRVVQREVFRRIWVVQSWPRQQLGHAELERLADLAGGKGPSAWDLPGGIRAFRELEKRSAANAAATDFREVQRRQVLRIVRSPPGAVYE